MSKVSPIVATALTLGLLGGTAFGQNITLTQLSTNFDNPIGIDYHEPTHSLIMSTNYSSGLPYNLERIEGDGAHFQYSALAGLTNELKIATVRSYGNPGNFVVGDVFTGNGNDGEVVRVTDGGATVLNPWVSLPGANNGLIRGSLYIDRTGVFGGNLIVATTQGEVWRIDNAGNPTLMANIGTHLEGAVTVPNNPAKYGPLAGKIMVGAEGQTLIYTIDPAGNTVSHYVAVKVEDIDFIEPNQSFYGVNFGTTKLLATPPSEFASMAGDILLTQEYPNAGGVGLYHLSWDGINLTANELTLTPASEVPGQWEHVTFAPIGVAPFPTCEITPPPPFMTSVGVPLNFTVTGMDTNPADLVTITATGVPAGATLNPPLPVVGNPVATTFSWTPNVTGTFNVVFTVKDSGGLETICEAIIEVAECYLFVGLNKTYQHVGPGADILHVVPVLVYPVTTEFIPSLPIPANAGLIGLHVYTQVGMLNPLMFPTDPVRMSNPLDIVIDGSVTSYDVGSGVTSWLEGQANIGGSIKVKFSIDS